jgi:multidrug efflux pump subunit AcrA (membrane-fusion protein)
MWTVRLALRRPYTFVVVALLIVVLGLVRELPKKPFEGVVANASGALDAASRTLLTEVRVRNAESTLRPGMYADVSSTSSAITLPSSSRPAP